MGTDTVVRPEPHVSPRPRKLRRCTCPRWIGTETVYKPAGVPLKDLEVTDLFLDELEAVRLCDGLGLTQTEAGTRMGVSRGTVQRLVTSGRRKLALTLIEGGALALHRHPEASAPSQATRTFPP